MSLRESWYGWDISFGVFTLVIFGALRKERYGSIIPMD